MAAAGENAGFELKQILVEMIDGLALDLLAAASRRLPILKARATSPMRRVVTLHVLANDLAVHQVGGFFRSIAQEALRRRDGRRRWMRVRFVGSVRGASWRWRAHFLVIVIPTAVERARVFTSARV